MQLIHLHKEFDKLQQEYGDPNLNAIYGAGQIKNPTFAFVFMNPTARNITADKGWQGIKAPWIGTKQVWGLFYKLELLSADIYNQILTKKPADWTPKFAETVYQDVATHNIYITNLAKSTQKDARKLPDSVFRAYLDLFWQEMHHVDPKIIVSFGTQVSSIILGKNIKISDWHGKTTTILGNNKKYKIAPVYYPVGQGAMNMAKTVGAVKQLLKQV